MSMKAKEVLAQKSTFSKPLTNYVIFPVTYFRLAHTKITEDVIAQALMTQVATKAPGPDKINFQNLQMI